MYIFMHRFDIFLNVILMGFFVVFSLKIGNYTICCNVPDIKETILLILHYYITIILLIYYYIKEL